MEGLTEHRGLSGGNLALALLAVKVGFDVLVGLALLGAFGEDASAWKICLVTGLGWLPILAIAAFLARPATGPLPWKPTRQTSLAAVLAVGATLILGSTALSYLLGDASTPIQDSIRGPADLIAVSVFALVMAPLVEEVFFRGFLYAALEPVLGPWLTVFLVGMIFGTFHGLQYIGVPAALAAVTLMGLATTWLRMATGSLLPCVALHVAYNLAGVCVLVFAP